MLIRAKIDKHSDWLFQEALTSDGSIKEQQQHINLDTLAIKNYYVTSNGFFLLHAVLRFSEDKRILIDVQGDAVVSTFLYCKKVLNNRKKSATQRSQHSIRYVKTESTYIDCEAGIAYTYFLLVLAKSYYLNLIRVAPSVHAHFLQEMENGNPVNLIGPDLQLTMEMRQTIDGMLGCKQRSKLKRMFLDAHIMELLMYQLEQLEQQLSQENDALTEVDVLKMEMLLELLQQQYKNSPTHKQLARKILLNESKLRVIFKRYFGLTIFEYINRLRMEEGRRLLLEHRQLTMAEIAEQIGFKHQASFTHAFKRYFGMPPKTFKS